jgi:branched-subunit amino acid aminotransferase/4-amino-4-deoxychorismate lyase
MDGPLAFLGGRWIAASELAVSAVDAGFVLGTTVSEQLRTFGGKLFRLDDHLARLRHSLEIIGGQKGSGVFWPVACQEAPAVYTDKRLPTPFLLSDELAEVAEQLAAHNHRLLAAGDDLGLSIFVTPGPYPAYAPPGPAEPTVGLHTYPLPFRLWAEKYRSGQAVVISEVRQISPRCWPPSLKCRSRMHYYLADQQAAAIEPGARAVLLDEEGFVTEASTANVIVFRRGEALISPPREKILHGISLAVTIDLAKGPGIPFTQEDLRPADLLAADEIFLTSTPLCLLPVTRCGGRPIGSGVPGEVFRRLLAAWSELVGLDIAAQAERFATRDA